MVDAALFSSSKMDWGTPWELFNKLNDEFNFTVDVCAHNENAKCDNYFSEETDGLSQDWEGTAWMNPPFGRSIPTWMEKAYNESQKGCTVVCLVPVRSDTKWWHDYVMKSSEIRLLRRRVKFQGAESSAPFPTAIIVFRPGANTPTLTAMDAR